VVAVVEALIQAQQTHQALAVQVSLFSATPAQFNISLVAQ
jgi:hypothetical protein